MIENELTTIPEQICFMASLRHLRLGGNKFESIPVQLGFLQKVEIDIDFQLKEQESRHKTPIQFLQTELQKRNLTLEQAIEKLTLAKEQERHSKLKEQSSQSQQQQQQQQDSHSSTQPTQQTQSTNNVRQLSPRAVAAAPQRQHSLTGKALS